MLAIGGAQHFQAGYHWFVFLLWSRHLNPGSCLSPVGGYLAVGTLLGRSHCLFPLWQGPCWHLRQHLGPEACRYMVGGVVRGNGICQFHFLRGLRRMDLPLCSSRACLHTAFIAISFRLRVPRAAPCCNVPWVLLPAFSGWGKRTALTICRVMLWLVLSRGHSTHSVPCAVLAVYLFVAGLAWTYTCHLVISSPPLGWGGVESWGSGGRDTTALLTSEVTGLGNWWSVRFLGVSTVCFHCGWGCWHTHPRPHCGPAVDIWLWVWSRGGHAPCVWKAGGEGGIDPAPTSFPFRHSPPEGWLEAMVPHLGRACQGAANRL